METSRSQQRETDHVAEDEADGAPVHDSKLERLELAHALIACAVRLDTTLSKTGNGDCALAFTESRCGGWEVKEEECCDNGPNDCCNALDDEEPDAQSVVIMSA